MKSIAILGSTGSIGTMSLEVIERLPDRFAVAALAAGRNIALLARQIRKFQPRLVAVRDGNAADELRNATGLSFQRIVAGEAGMIQVATEPEADMVIAAIAGAAGLKPTWHAVMAGKTVGLANKESLVMGGSLLMSLARERGSTIIPIDSEHSAIFQCLQGNRRDDVASIILTASGGPFRGLSAGELEVVRPEQALAHPVWSMGRKVSIDSATLMNKGLEVIEARWLFDVPAEKIEVVIHPQSIIHSMVRYRDGSVISHLSQPDMRIPILFALSFPERLDAGLPRLDLIETGRLTFEAPDLERFPCLGYAFDALKRGAGAPIVLNRADELSVNAFLEGTLTFGGISRVIRQTLARFDDSPVTTLEDIDRIDRWASETAISLISS